MGAEHGRESRHVLPPFALASLWPQPVRSACTHAPAPAPAKQAMRASSLNCYLYEDEGGLDLETRASLATQKFKLGGADPCACAAAAALAAACCSCTAPCGQWFLHLR